MYKYVLTAMQKDLHKQMDSERLQTSIKIMKTQL